MHKNLDHISVIQLMLKPELSLLYREIFPKLEYQLKRAELYFSEIVDVHSRSILDPQLALILDYITDEELIDGIYFDWAYEQGKNCSQEKHHEIAQSLYEEIDPYLRAIKNTLNKNAAVLDVRMRMRFTLKGQLQSAILIELDNGD